MFDYSYTTLNFILKFHRVIVKFIVGDGSCHIPPQDRVDRYSCEPDALVDPGNINRSL